MFRHRPLPLALLALWLGGCASDPRSRPMVPDPVAATLVLHGGRIWTGDPDRPAATAIAIRGPRIVAVGDDDQILACAGPSTRRIDLRGLRVVPGLTDAHVHFIEGGSELLAPDLRTATSEEEFAGRVGKAVSELPTGAWLTIGQWDHESWPGGDLPTREVLDRFTPDHPVFLSRLDGHMAIANSVALRIAGVTATTESPPGGTIVRDAETGEPTGVLKDNAMGLVSRHIPPPSPELRLAWARAAVRHAATLGVTSVHDMLSSHEPLGVYQELRRADELTVRVTLYVPIASVSDWSSLEVERGLGDRFLRISGVKAFADGSLGSSTALFFDPYVDAPDTRGLAVTDLSPGGALETRIATSRKAGLQVATHAIGDRANREVLDIYERTSDGAEAAGRPRIEHAQHLHPDDIARFGEEGVIASMQPYHAVDDGRWAEDRIGAERCRTTYAFRDLIDRGATLAFGSDWPVAPLSPILGIHAAVTRATLDGEHPDGWIPEQRISVEEALRAYTLGGARAAHQEHDLGSLTAGKLADLVVLDRDILESPPERIPETRVLLTIVDGRIIHHDARAIAVERHGEKENDG